MLNLERLQAEVGSHTIVQLSDDNGDGIADTLVIQLAIDVAVREVRFALDLDNRPLSSEEEDLASTLAIARLYERRRETIPEAWQKRVEHVRQTLRMVSARSFLKHSSAASNRTVDERSTNPENLDRL